MKPPKKRGNKTETFDGANEFIALMPSSDDEAEEADRAATRDNSQNGHSSGRKRTAEQLDAERPSTRRRQDQTQFNRSTPWTWSIDWSKYHDLPKMFHAEVMAFSNYVSPTDEEHESRRLIIMLVERVVKRRWSDATVLPFGSFETKLYHPLGDIDLVIQSRRMETLNRKNILYQLADLLRREGITDHVQVIAHARVPIVKFVTTYGNFAVDVSINQDNGLKSGRIVNGFLHELPALRPLAMVVKAFLRERKANEVFNGGLGSYSTVCLLVNFLQMHPKLRSGEIRAEENLGTLLIEFFELYGQLFNSRDVGLSLRYGGSYYSKTARGWLDSRQPMLLSIEDPHDASNDVSKGSFNIHNVFRHFAGAHEMLTSISYQRAATFDSMRRGRHIRFDHPARQDMGILGSLMGIDEEMLEHRRRVRELYESGLLHDWLGIAKRHLGPRPPSVPPPPMPAPSPPIDISRLRAQSSLEKGEEEMAMSDDDAESTSSGDSDQDTRYAAQPSGSKRKQTSYEEYQSSNEGDTLDLSADFVLHTAERRSEDTSPGPDDSSPPDLKSSQPKSSSGRVKIDRKRDFWASKSG
ncbi:Nucleotidyltransferase [Auriculariales sp. MPI-PUGE-AT-0066]|nr:Nucleotidyltransferase [Auriculariales sp. MPI-PUGE-AT-0066]